MKKLLILLLCNSILILIILKSANYLPVCLKMYLSIEHHSSKYNIPSSYAYGIAFKETGYEGPFHWKYNPYQTSNKGAVGPMQIMYSTAKGIFPERDFNKNELKNNIDFNVECSMKLLNELYSKHKNWKLVFGAYNTGKPRINHYSNSVFNFKR